MSVSAADERPPPGGRAGAAVELREDVPLTAHAAHAGHAVARHCAGPRLIAAAFAALSLAITLALLSQIYCGDYEVVPHGSVSSSVGACSEGGARLLRAGGGALDAAAAAALCHAASAADPLALDASGSLLYWEYRRAHGDAPTLTEWGPAGAESNEERPPLLLAALAALHVRHGLLPWSLVLQPAIDLVEAVRGMAVRGAGARGIRGANCGRRVARVRRRRGGGAAAGALRSALSGDDAGISEWLRQGGADNVTAGSGLAVVDPQGTYVALVTGAARGAGGADGAAADDARPDLAPAIIVDGHICGTRYVVGAGSGGALVQTAAALARGVLPADAVEAARSAARGGGAPVNLVRQRADALLSHADSRAGGLAARF